MTGKFKHFGEFLSAIRVTAQGHFDPRLGIGAGPTTSGRESVGSDGGFAIPTEFLADLNYRIRHEGTISGQCRQVSVTTNDIVFPSNSQAPWEASAAIRARWEDEGTRLPADKPQIEANHLRPRKLTVLLPATGALAEDTSGIFGEFAEVIAGDAISYALDRAVVGGNGVARPLGIMNSPALITVAKEGSQTADTINIANLSKMMARMLTASVSDSTWLVGPDAYAQLMLADLLDRPASGSNLGWGTLFSRPIIASQALEPLGDLGDVILADLDQYVLLTREL